MLGIEIISEYKIYTMPVNSQYPGRPNDKYFIILFYNNNMAVAVRKDSTYSLWKEMSIKLFKLNHNILGYSP